MDLRREFVDRAMSEGSNISALCLEYGIGRTLGHKVLARFRAEGEIGLVPQSRRPETSPQRAAPAVEAAALAVRAAHPAWGGRKIAAVLARQEVTVAPSTVTGILRRNGVPLGQFGGGAKAFLRFEHGAPNDLWQMDFKGHVALQGTARLHPLTVLDDHSRYAITLEACANETTEMVKSCLIRAFRSHGLPRRMAMDNGAPWGDRGGQPYTLLTVWLIEAGVAISHSRPMHPQTLGKDERFHRSLKAEALAGQAFASLDHAQRVLSRWQHVYNHERPHEALALATPASRYQRSTRVWRERPEPFDYPAGDLVRKVQRQGMTWLHGHEVKLPKAFLGKQIAFRPTATDGVYDAWFRNQNIKPIDLRDYPK